MGFQKDKIRSGGWVRWGGGCDGMGQGDKYVLVRMSWLSHCIAFSEVKCIQKVALRWERSILLYCCSRFSLFCIVQL